MYRPNIVKTCFACGRYIVKSHTWENQDHACYTMRVRHMRHRKTACFQALVLHPHFAQMLRPLLATLLLGRQKFAACIIYLNDANCESPGFFQHLRAAHDLERRMIFFPLSMQSPNKHCIETVEPFARADRPNSLVFYLHSKASTTLESSFAVGTS